MVNWNYLDFTEMMEKAEKFFQGIDPEKRTALIYHGDADGVTSAVFISKTLEKIIGRIPKHRLWVSTRSYKMKEERLLIDQIAPDYLIVTDLDLGKESELLQHWANTIEKIFIYDHHTIKPDYQENIPRSIEYINPRMLGMNDVWHPASYFGYELHKRFSKKNYFEWLVSIGLRGDHALDNYPEIIETIQSKFPEIFTETMGNDHKNLLEKAVYYINAAFFNNPKAYNEIAFRVLLKAWDADDYKFICSQDEEALELKKKRDEIQTDIQRIIKEADDNIKLYEDIPLVVYLIDTPHYILGVIASILKDKYSDKIVMVLNRFDDDLSGEIRRGESVDLDLVKILGNVSKEFKFISMGGHPPAAGFLIENSSYDEFLTILEKVMNELD